MASPTASDIKDILLTAVYPENTLNSDNVFDYPQKERRRRYPSCDIKFTQPDSTVEDKRQTFKINTLEISYYKKLLGQGSDEVKETDSVQAAIIGVLESATLAEHKIILESKIWSNDYVQADNNHPSYIVSILRVSIRQITPSTAAVEGFLIFDVSESNVDSPPAGDYTYTEVFDVDISEGFRTIKEQITTNPEGINVPVFYAGMFDGRFICNVSVKDDDIGTTGEKLNKLNLLKANARKPLIAFQYKDKDNQEAPMTITDAVKIMVDQVQRLYRYNDMVVYRIIGTVVKPSTITTA